MKKLGLAVFCLMVGAACSNQNFSLPKQANNFQQAPQFNNKVDILFVMDDSSSMTRYQDALSEQMATMVGTLSAMGMDYHIAVTSTSVGTGFTGGKLIGSPKYLTNATPNAGAALTARVRVGSGADLEQGLLSVKNALSNLTGESAGFLREDAMLAVIVMSTEDDYSAGSVQSYADLFNTIKKPFANGAKSWVMNFLGIIDLNPNCTTSIGPITYIETGLRYMDLATRSDGVKESICTGNWANMVTNVKVRINQLMTDFYLNRKPKLNTIVVTNNGKSVPNDAVNGWTYEEKTDDSGVLRMYIRFHGTAIPSLYDSIDIKFDPASAT